MCRIYLHSNLDVWLWFWVHVDFVLFFLVFYLELMIIVLGNVKVVKVTRPRFLAAQELIVFPSFLVPSADII